MRYSPDLFSSCGHSTQCNVTLVARWESSSHMIGRGRTHKTFEIFGTVRAAQTVTGGWRIQPPRVMRDEKYEVLRRYVIIEHLDVDTYTGGYKITR